MIKQSSIPLNKWVEFSGGSRPNTNKVMFESIGQGLFRLHIRCVVDWETEEIVYLTFTLTQNDLDELFSQVVANGYGRLAKETNTEKLIFECKEVEGKTRIRFDGTNSGKVDRPIAYILNQFADLIIE